jgi:hypothetical protein
MSDIDDNTIFTTELSEDEEKQLDQLSARQVRREILRKHEHSLEYDAPLVVDLPQRNNRSQG